MNKKIKLIVDDVELEVLVSEKDLAKLTEKKQKKTGYERAAKREQYYMVTGDNTVRFNNDNKYPIDEEYYMSANYYSDKTVAENNARADKLMRQLRRFAAENCKEVPWDNKVEHWYIRHGGVCGSLFVDLVTYSKEFGAI